MKKVTRRRFITQSAGAAALAGTALWGGRPRWARAGDRVRVAVHYRTSDARSPAVAAADVRSREDLSARSEEHTSELQSL